VADVQQVIFDILTRDRASEGLSKIGRAADGAAKDTTTLRHRLEELANKSYEARTGLKGDKESEASIDRLDAKLLALGRRIESPTLKVEGAARAIAEMEAVNAEFDHLGGKGGSAASATAGLSTLSGPSGMGALIGAGVVLSPIITTLAFGLGGFGLAAAGVAKPIENAAKKTGGLQANMGLLNKEQQTVAKGLLGLGAQFHTFEGQLQPEVLKVFSSGLHLAGSLLHDVEPVAKATGTALNGMLGSIDKEFRSGTWQQFFGFMAQTAGPDVKLLTTDVLGLVHALPAILETLQPVASGILDTIGKTEKLSGEIAVLTSNLVTLNHAVPKQGPGDNNPLKWLSDQNIIHGIKFINDLLPRALQHAAEGAGALKKSGDAASKSTAVMGDKAATAAWHVQTLAQQVTALTTAESKSLDTQLAYSNALLTQKNDALNLRTALKASGDSVGFDTQKKRDSFSAANTYINDLVNTAKQAWASGKGIDGQRAAIRQALPLLDSVKTKSKLYWEEVRTLKQWLDKLNAEKNIREVVVVSGSGSWTMHNPRNQSLPGGFPGGTGAAGGMLVRGGIPGRDSVPILAMPGEAVVPARLVPAVAPFLRAQGVPGFAAGGIVPSYGGPVKGLQPWAAHDLIATNHSVLTSLGNAIAAAVTAAARAATTFGGGLGRAGLRWLENLWTGAGGPGGGTAHVAAAIALAESGGNPNAFNPSGASGLWQILGAVAPGNLFNPQVNALNAVIKYRDAGGFSPWVTFETGAYRQFMDSGGWLAPGPSLVYNGTGRPEHLVPSSGGNNYTINVHVPVSGSKRETGRAVVEAIREFEKGAGKSWRA
jgi:hypothetical protein